MLYAKTSLDLSWPLCGMQPRIIRLRRNVTELEQRLTNLEQVVQEEDQLLQLAVCLAANQIQEEEKARTNSPNNRKSSDDLSTSSLHVKSPKKKISNRSIQSNAVPIKLAEVVTSFTVKNNSKNNAESQNGKKINQTRISQKEVFSSNNTNKKKNIPVNNNNNNTMVNDKNKDIKSEIRCDGNGVKKSTQELQKVKESRKPKHSKCDLASAKKLLTVEMHNTTKTEAKRRTVEITSEKQSKKFTIDNTPMRKSRKQSIPQQLKGEGNEHETKIQGPRRGRSIKNQRNVLSVQIDCEQPAQDDIFDVKNFETFLNEKFKVHGKVNNLGSNVTIELNKSKITITTVNVHFPKRYVKYLSKKYLKKKGMRDLVRVVAPSTSNNSNDNSYQLRYYKFAGEDSEVVISDDE